MRAAQTTLRRPALLLPRRAERPRRECAGTAHSGAVWLFGTMFLAGYLPGIWLGRGGVSALGQQLAAYYTKSPENAAFAAIFGTEFSVSFLQLTAVFLCGFCVLGVGLLALLFAGVVLTASAMQITSTMKHPEITDVQRERAAFLQESGLTFGYATFWNANVITELTNGEVEAVGITIAQNEKGQGVPRVSEWLEAQENRRMERPDERVFMLLTEAESERLDDFLKKSGAQARCARDGMTAYEIESQRIFFETAQAMDTP